MMAGNDVIRFGGELHNALRVNRVRPANGRAEPPRLYARIEARAFAVVDSSVGVGDSPR